MEKKTAVSKRYISTVLFSYTNFTVALILFSSGFLLKRLEVQKYSEHETCHQVETSPDFSNCTVKPTFRKALIIVVDALRYDFVSFNFSTSGMKELPFQNKMKSVANILKKQPQNSVLYKFIADPPTTTLQRLKGMTTGSLPTFVDAGSNFAGSDITEDNIIRQIVQSKMNITFMGDDVWLRLFPVHFNKAFPYPSLNVKDLDTVDNGVVTHLQSELKQKDWNVVIGHFLGVDHCGHTFGPNHPKMKEKLQQMDKVLM